MRTTRCLLSLMGIAVIAAAATAAAADDAPLASWQFADDRAAQPDGPHLKFVGDAKPGVALAGADLEASLARGGDGVVAAFTGGHAIAGTPDDPRLNPGGDAFTLLIRLRDPSGKWDTSIFSRHGGHDRLVYNLFSVDLGSPGMDLGFELGTDRGMFQVKVPVAQLDPPNGWHDLIARYDGKRLELFIDGVLVDHVAASGKLRQKNPEPLVIGGESTGGKVIRPFQGFIDHAAIYSRAISDAEVIAHSGGEAEVTARRTRVAEAAKKREAEIVAKLGSDPQRPAYHFLPPRNWMNDPNGLIQFNGQYHLFYQHNPRGAEWGNMTWGHAVSKDLVRWQHLPHALHPDQPYDDDGVFSGCMVNNNGTAVAVYTGTQPEVQAIAIAKDKELRTFEKHEANPVIRGPPKGIEVTGFRDPYVWKEGETWYMVVGSGIKDVGGAILLYRSPDLVKWEYVHPACVGKAAETGPMWECPSFFPLGDGGTWVLIISPIGFGRAIYFTGTWKDLKFTPQRQGEIDVGGALYAPQVFADEQGRRIMFGWLWENREGAAQAGWQGVQSLPRVLTLGADGRLNYAPAKEVDTLRQTEHATVKDLDVFPGPGGPQVRGDRTEVLVGIDPGDATHVGLEVRASPGGEEKTIIVYDRAAKTLSIDRRQSSAATGPAKDVRTTPFELKEGEPLRLRVFLDRSVIEVFANDHTALTARIYPSRPDSVGGRVFALGGKAAVRSLRSWEMESIWETSQK